MLCKNKARARPTSDILKIIGRKLCSPVVGSEREAIRDWLPNVYADGGGIRGYATLLLLKSLMQEVANEERFADQALRHEVGITHYASNTDPLKHLPPLPCHYFDYIIGTSTGG
jgi:hypothetical protein